MRERCYRRQSTIRAAMWQELGYLEVIVMLFLVYDHRCVNKSNNKYKVLCVLYYMMWFYDRR